MRFGADLPHGNLLFEQQLKEFCENVFLSIQSLLRNDGITRHHSINRRNSYGKLLS